MVDLHKAALRRAYRTLAQGLGGSTVVTAVTAVVAALGDADAVRTAGLAALISVGTTIATAVGSFWQGVAAGLPEVGVSDEEAEQYARDYVDAQYDH